MSADGVLNLYKPAGPTSHDCVNRARRAMGTRRVGHAGTLDPMAEGVLLIGVGQGTRVLDYLQGLPKTYRARMVFGLVTDTQDTTGRTLEERDASGLTQQEVEEALEPFRGEQLQLPPMVSALKVGGRRLYELHRRGESVERQPRPVHIYSLELLSFEPGPQPEAELRVVCSAGTYVRTLCHDLGEQLGTGAAMSALVREQVGQFRAADAVPLEALNADTPLVPLAEALGHLPAFAVDDADATRIGHGQFITAPEDVPDGPVRVLNSAGRLIAVGRAHGHGEARLLSLEKVLVTADAASSWAG